MAGLLINENVAQGLSPTNTFQAGVTNVDTGRPTQRGILLPWVIDPSRSWLNYVCWIACKLDSGIVVHRQLPQTAQEADTLGSAAIETFTASGSVPPVNATFPAPSFEDENPLNTLSDRGVNLKSRGNYTDTVQRMAHSVYRFCLQGWARRAGYQIPIPALVSVAGVQAIPDDEMPLEGFNVVIGNNGGVPIYFARWSLWYTTAKPPTEAQPPPDNLAELIGAIDPAYLPEGIQMPVSAPDQKSVPSGPILPPLDVPI